MMFESGNRSSKSPENIQVWGLGGEGHRDGCVGSLAVQTGTGQACAGHEVGNGFHRAGDPPAGLLPAVNAISVSRTEITRWLSLSF